MEKKFFRIFLLFVAMLLVTSCKDKEESEDKKVNDEVKQNITVMEKNEDGTIKKGTLEGYTFTETSEKTDRVKLEMENGDVMLIVLSNADTPITIANFKKLVADKFYDGLTFHRIVSGFMIQGGDPDGTGSGGAKDTIKGEFASNGVKNDLKHTKGVISMARSGDPNSASSQFFIMHGTATHLDGSYAAFGKVFAGLEIVDKIASTEVTDNGYGEQSKPKVKPVIKTIRFVTVEKA